MGSQTFVRAIAEMQSLHMNWSYRMLFEHPAVQEACVIATHDPRRGESVKADIMLRNGEHVTEEELVSCAREHMASYKVPRVIQFAPYGERKGPVATVARS
jgi:acyl-CoA synthetase (AMP-forming)/AMP-acid ligase II